MAQKKANTVTPAYIIITPENPLLVKNSLIRDVVAKSAVSQPFVCIQ